MTLDYSEIILGIEERERENLTAMKEQDVAVPIAPGKWSKKEILGHLIDSAGNNHQRFVRASLSDELVFPPYAQTDWVKCQDYADESWRLLVDLWSSLNLHLAHVIANIEPDMMTVPCTIGDKAPITLEELIADYVRHMEHHLRQLNGLGG